MVRIKRKALKDLDIQIEEAYSKIPCYNCLVRPKCFTLLNDGVSFIVEEGCKEYYKWSASLHKFWKHKKYIHRVNIRRKILQKLFLSGGD